MSWKYVVRCAELGQDCVQCSPLLWPIYITVPKHAPCPSECSSRRWRISGRCRVGSWKRRACREQCWWGSAPCFEAGTRTCQWNETAPGTEKTHCGRHETAQSHNVTATGTSQSLFVWHQAERIETVSGEIPRLFYVKAGCMDYRYKCTYRPYLVLSGVCCDW